jgi:hypothetical protein
MLDVDFELASKAGKLVLGRDPFHGLVSRTLDLSRLRPIIRMARIPVFGGGRAGHGWNRHQAERR